MTCSKSVFSSKASRRSSWPTPSSMAPPGPSFRGHLGLGAGVKLWVRPWHLPLSGPCSSSVPWPRETDLWKTLVFQTDHSHSFLYPQNIFYWNNSLFSKPYSNSVCLAQNFQISLSELSSSGLLSSLFEIIFWNWASSILSIKQILLGCNFSDFLNLRKHRVACF